MSFVLLALLLPQAREARRRTQFQRFGLLLAGNLDGFEETRLGFCLEDRGSGVGGSSDLLDLLDLAFETVAASVPL